MESSFAQTAGDREGAADEDAHHTLINAPISKQPADWIAEMRGAIRSLDKLLGELHLDAEAVGVSATAARQFPVLVTREWLAAMEKGNPADPLLLQVLPTTREEEVVPGFIQDPLQETSNLDTPGIVRKYRGRALLVVTGACAVHCRYCFRRHYPYQQGSITAGRWQDVMSELRSDAELQEVILSGGDPLLVGNDRLATMLDDLAGLDGLRWLRIHTRLPLVLPQRIDAGLCKSLSSLPVPVAVVVHCNHPNELTPAVRSALSQLRTTGATLLNQSVLLRGVNDDQQTLINLSTQLYASGVLPYYLHLLDPVAGAAHFLVEEDLGQELHTGIKARLPGYLVPRLVREVPGDDAKRWVG